MPLLNIAVAFNAVAKKNDGILKVLSEGMANSGIDPVTFLNFPAGLVLPVKAKKIFDTGTAASNLIGIE